MNSKNLLADKKIAIVHDALIHLGGAERVLFSLLELFPTADFYTSIANQELLEKVSKNNSRKITFSQFSRCWLAHRYSSLLKPYFFHYYWESLKLDNYDLVISSSHSFCSNLIRVGGVHISYQHTPPKFLFNEFNEMTWIKKPIIKLLFSPYFYFLKKKIFKKIQKIDLLIANSKEVQNRIRRYFNKQSLLIYPPVRSASKNEFKKAKKRSYLFFSRLVKQKGIELVIKTFNQNKKQLLVVGTSDQINKWKKLAKNNIIFLGFVSDKKMPEIYQKTKALIYASMDEDFGLVPLEALSHGIPVIAYKSGGIKEYLKNKLNCIFFTEYNENALDQSIREFEKTAFKSEECTKSTRSFSEDIFKEKIISACQKQLELANK